MGKRNFGAMENLFFRTYLFIYDEYMRISVCTARVCGLVCWAIHMESIYSIYKVWIQFFLRRFTSADTHKRGGS